MDFQGLLKAGLMNQATHTGGHMEEAYRQGMRPAYVDWSEGVEVVPRWVNNPQNDQQKRAAGIWHSAGFEEQQETARKLEGTGLEGDFRLTEGLYKLGYLAGLHSSNTQGDVESLTRISGNKATPGLLGFSALVDLYKSQNPDPSWDINFIAPSGAPGLLFSREF